MIENKMPKTYDELIKDKVFLSFIDSEIETVRNERRSRIAPKNGFHYRRDAIDSMWENGELCGNYIMKHLRDVIIKKSNISSNKRSIVEYVYERALNETFNHYNQTKK